MEKVRNSGKVKIDRLSEEGKVLLSFHLNTPSRRTRCNHEKAMKAFQGTRFSVEDREDRRIGAVTFPASFFFTTHTL